MRVAILFLASTAVALAYEVDTHGRITQAAFERSVLATDTALYQRLGFDRLDLVRPFDTPWEIDCVPNAIFPHRDAYADPEGDWATLQLDSDIRFRCPEDYERRVMPPTYSGRVPSGALGNLPQLRFEGWLMRGAIREDDLEQQFYTNPSDAPAMGPWGDITRPTHHFYSPVTNTSDSLGTQSALPWALGESDPFAANSSPDATRENHFSYADAVRNYYLALTYQQPDPVNGTNARQDAVARMALWSSAMKSLGHTAHLLQDMGQPQHVRGERHNYVCRGIYAIGNQDTANRTYENFSNFRVTDNYNNVVRLAGGSDLYIATNACEETEWLDLFSQSGVPTPPPITPFSSSTYRIPTFSRARKYFTTRVASDTTVIANLPLSTLNARAGLADYTNRGFYTQDNGAGLYQSPPAIGHPSVVEGDAETVVVPGLGTMRLKALYWDVPDVVDPAYVDTNSDGQGRSPIASASYWSKLGFPPDIVLTLSNYTQMGDMLGPRAIAYSAGLINHMFRGRLEVTPTTQNAFAVLNQGEVHSVDFEGYPRRANNSIFGFEKVRLRVRNITESVTDSGPAAPAIPQTSGSGTLVAVARYHRNACYRSDMSGERIRGYAPPPGIGSIVEPTCSAGTPARTTHQEISVSAPLTIASSADLPGGVGSGGGAPAAIEKTFDFAADPIPVNATDLFIQVIYRGQLGDEPDAVAVGNYDVREPTFIGIYNNTDYYWNGTVMQWLYHQGSQFPWQNADYVRVCTGASTESRWAYYAEPVAGFPPLGIPSPDPGVIRLAFLFAMPNGAQQFVVRVTPVTDAAISPFQRSFFTSGRQKQANKELVDAAVVAAPQFCSNLAPTGTAYWCDDPISRRRGLALGNLVAGVYYDTGFGNPGGDVDAQPLPTFAGPRLTSTGTLKWNDATLVACPPPPTALAGSQELTELLEMAADEGILIE